MSFCSRSVTLPSVLAVSAAGRPEDEGGLPPLWVTSDVPNHLLPLCASHLLFPSSFSAHEKHIRKMKSERPVSCASSMLNDEVLTVFSMSATITKWLTQWQQTPCYEWIINFVGNYDPKCHFSCLGKKVRDYWVNGTGKRVCRWRSKPPSVSIFWWMNCWANLVWAALS